MMAQTTNHNWSTQRVTQIAIVYICCGYLTTVTANHWIKQASQWRLQKDNTKLGSAIVSRGGGTTHCIPSFVPVSYSSGQKGGPAPQETAPLPIIHIEHFNLTKRKSVIVYIKLGFNFCNFCFHEAGIIIRTCNYSELFFLVQFYARRRSEGQLGKNTPLTG